MTALVHFWWTGEGPRGGKGRRREMADVKKMGTWVAMTPADIADMEARQDPATHPFADVGIGVCIRCGNPPPGHYVPTAEEAARWEAARAQRELDRLALYSGSHVDLTPDEGAAVGALYGDPDLEVGREGIGGFYAGQAEATIRTLRKAGFRITRESRGD